MQNDKPLYTLYKSLLANNFDVPKDYASFEATLTQKGDKGTKARLQLHKSLVQNNFDVPKDYASFANTLFVPTAKSSNNNPNTTQTVNKPQTSVQKNVRDSRRTGMGRLHDGESALPQRSNDGIDRAFNRAIGLGDKTNIQRINEDAHHNDQPTIPHRNYVERHDAKPKNKRISTVPTLVNGVVRDAYVTDMGNKYLDADEADKEQMYSDFVDKAIGEEWDKARKREIDAISRNERGVTNRVNWGGRGTAFEGAVNQGVSNVAAHMTAYDLQKMSDRAWAKVKSALTNYYYKQLNPNATKADNIDLLRQAEAMARQKSDQSVYEYAVRQNAPKGALDYLAKSVADSNLASSVINGAARVKAGTTGDMDAYDEAMARYGEKHPWQAAGSTVLGMGADPTTYIGGFVGGQAGKLALRAVGKVMLRKGAVKAAKGVGERLASRTLGGRLAASVGSGIGNLGYYEMSKDVEDQWRHGGALNQETGKREYSVMDVVKSTCRGALLGGAMGIMGPMVGNVTDRWVRGTNSAWGKTGIKAGGYLTSAVAEGTIFAAPEFVHNMMLEDGDPNKRSYMDIWGGSMTQIAGFKLSGAIKGLKSAPEFIHSLRPISDPKTPADFKRNRLSFGEVWSKKMDNASNDLDFTRDELAELKAAGHLKLADLFKRTKSEGGKIGKDGKPVPKVTDSKDRKVIYFNPIQNKEDVKDLDFDGYDAMEALMRDKTVSQSTRAKAYYILTGRGLPMSTVIGYSKVKDADGGGVTIKATSADDEVVTSKHFKTDKDAEGYVNNIKRQAELNYIEAGEIGVEEKVSNDVFKDVVTDAFAGEDLQKVVDTYANYVSGRDKSAEAKGIFDKIQEGIEKRKEDIKGKLPEAIRERIRKTTGVDIDKALHKTDGKRSQEEQNAVDEYIQRLYDGREETKEEPSTTDDIIGEGIEPPMGVGTNDAEHEPLREEQPKDPRENQETGMLHGATLRVDDKHVHIVSGKVVAREDGTIDEAASDPTIVVYNDETGEKKMFSPKDFRSVEEPTSGDVPPSLSYQDGVSYVGGDGTQRRGIVNRVNEDGTIEVVTDDGRIERYGQDDFANIVDEVERDGETVFKRGGKMGDEKSSAAESGAAESGVPTEEAKPTEEAMTAEEKPLTEEGSAEEVMPTKEAKPKADEEERISTTTEKIKPTEERIATEEEKPTEDRGTTEEVKPTEESVAHTEGEVPHEEAPKTALERVPKDETGEPKYEETDAKTAWDAIVEQTDGDEDMAEMVVDSMIGDKIKELDGLRKKGIMSGGTIAEKIAAEKKLRGEIEDAQRVLGHWQEIKKQKGWKEGVSDEGKASEVKSEEKADAIEGKSDATRKVKGGERADAKANEGKTVAEKGEEVPKTEVKAEEGQNEANGDGSVSNGEEFAPIGKGVFGNIYDQFKGKVKEAFAFLKKIGGGEALAVLHHRDVGDIALVWGNEKAGAMKILRKHPEVVDNLQELMDGMHVVSSSDNRIVLESDMHKAVVSKKLGDKETEQWLLTAYEKKNAAKGGSSDIGPKPQTEGGKQNGTAPLQDGSSSDGKGTKNGDGVQVGEGKKTSETADEDVKKATLVRLQKAVHVLLHAIKSGEGKDEAISELERVVKDVDKGEAAKNFLISYWMLDRFIKDDGDKVSEDHALCSEVLGYLRDALEENGVGVIDGAKGVKVGDVVCYKKREFKDAKAYYEKAGRVVSVDRGSVEMDDGVKVVKRSVLGYCRVKDDGVNGEKSKGVATAEHVEMGGVNELKENGGTTEKPTDKLNDGNTAAENGGAMEKPATEKPTEKTKEKDAADDGSEKKPKGDGVSEPKGETASEGEKKPTEKKPTEKSKGEKPTGDSEEKIDDVGEKIVGARKDILRDMAKKMNDVTLESLIALPFAKAFKRPKLKEAVEKGVLRKKDARFADAVMCAFLSKAKPRLLSGWKAQKSKMEIVAWAKDAYNGVKLLKMLMDGEEKKRDALIEEVMGWKMYDEDAVKAKQRQYEEWNEGKKFEGECYPINPVKLFMDVFERLGYDSYGELKFPFAEVRPDMTFDSYDLYRANGKRLYLRRDLTSYDDVVDEAVYLTKLMVADEELDHPKDRFKLKGDDPIYETIGWMVNAVTVKGKKQSVKQHVFKTKEEAEKFREEFKEKMGANGYVGSAMEDKRFEAWGSFEIAFHNDLTDAYVDTGLKFKTREEAAAAIDEEHERLNEVVNGKLREELEAAGEKVGKKKDYVSVMQMYKDGKWMYAVALDDKYAPRLKKASNTMPYTLAEGFETVEEAEKYIEEHRGEIDARVEEIKKRRREFVYFNGKDNPRVGEDYRKGEDVTAEQFREQFGFRGVQFGNWTNQRDRQAAVNNAFDGFMDLAKVLGVSPRALSLNGELGIAFGARGGGKASAHYELKEVVINLTKTKGAGSLAHEWWHALDNYFARRGNVKFGMVTENKELKMREELRKAFNALVDDVEKSDYDKRSSKKGVYWGSRSEETARLFETWVSDELMKKGEVNNFLTSRDTMAEDRFARMNYLGYKCFAEFAGKEVMSFEDYKKTASALNGFVYPTSGELDVLGLKVRKIFDTIQTRVDEATKNVVMYHRGRVVERTRSKAERALLGAVIGIQKRMGLSVLTDVDEGQRVLDLVNGGAREHRVFHGSGAEFEKFDHSHMGDGEGAQAFGWGTYVTEVEGIGRTYAENNPKLVEHSDFEREDALYDIAKKLEEKYGVDDGIDELIYDGNGDFDSLTISKDNASLEKWKAYFEKHDGEFDDWERGAKDFDLSDEYDVSEFADIVERSIFDNATEIAREYDNLWGEDEQRILYTVEIPDERGENYLRWDEALSDGQIEKIRQYLSENYRQKKLEDFDASISESKSENAAELNAWVKRGENVYKTLEYLLGSDKEVSKALNEMGFVGIKYPAEYRSGGREDGKMNYVVFNEGDLAIVDHVKFFRTMDGEAYGFTVGGRIYLDPRVATAETALHEYAHLWAEALREANREEWDNVVKLMRGTKVWDEVKGLYPELNGDDEVADEVVAMYSGRRGSERLREEMRKVMEGNGSLKERTAAVSALGRVKSALEKFWRGVAEFLGIHFTSAEEVADKVMADMLSGVDPTKVKKSERVKKQIVGEIGAERLDREEMERGERMMNLEVAKVMAKEGRDAKTVKLATGWERGKDGMWRYEIGDLRVKGNAKVDMEKGRTMVVGRKVSEPIAKLGDLVDAGELFKAYPGLRDVDVVVDKSGESGRNGSYSMLYGHIALNGNQGFFKEVHAPKMNDEALARLEKLYDGLSEEEKIFADDGVDHFGGFTDEELARDVVFQRLEGNRPKVAAYVREALKVWQGDGGEVIGYRLNDDERTCEVLTHEVQHAIQDLEGFEGGGNPKMGRHIARERNKLTEMQQMLVDDVKLYDEMMDDERSREKYPLSAFIRDNVRDGVYDEDFGKVLVGMSDEELRGEAERLMGMDGERLDGFEAYRRLAGEVEARNASTRRGMSVDEKRGSLLEETEDVPRENQILQRGDKNNESSTSERTASELGQPSDDSADVANFNANSRVKKAVERIHSEWRGAVSDLASKLGLEGVDVIEGTEGLTEEQRGAKGWFDKETGRIVVVLGNHGSKGDVMRTVLHEGVCHFGLRGLMGEEGLKGFLDGVFAKIDEGTRKRIAEDARKHGWNVRVATEEYLASMAETMEFEDARKSGVWGKVKMLFGNVLRAMGFGDGRLTDNELRFVLRMSYDRLKRGGREGWLDRANRIALERRLKVGRFEERKALTKEEERNVEKNVLYREDRDRIVARDDYEREVSAAKHKLNVAWADSMSSLKILQDAIGRNGGKIEDWENAYMAENRMSSKNLAEMEAYKKSFYTDLIDAVDELTSDGGATYDGVKEYMLAKHGLERNDVFAMRDAKRKADEITRGKIRKLEGIMNNPYATTETKKRVSAAINMMEAMRDGVRNVLSAEDAKKWYDKRLKAIEGKYKKGKYTDEQRDEAKRSLDAIMKDGLAQSFYYEFRKRDYSGLTALTDMDNVVDAELAARDIVDGFEAEHDTTNLWEKTNAATEAMLTKDYESGLITKDMYGTLKTMFKYYIPLQGFDAKTSDEVYTYMDNHNGRMGGVIRKAEGRNSLADDPIATIGNNASRSIMMANRNEMKQHFLKMVMNHPSDLVSVNKMYLHYDALTGEWVPQFADIPEGADAQTVKKITDAFYDRMEKLCKKAPDEYKVADEKANVPFKVVGANMNEHQVHVKMLGRDYVLTINGNPEAAQALNGLLAPEGHQGFAKLGNNVNNFMAKMFTQKNPAFIVTNLSRDAIYANTMVVAKENKVYRRRFHRNFGKNFVRLMSVMRRYSKGKLRGDSYDKYYKEFVMNGGQTGYAFTKSVKEYKKLISKELEQRHRSKLNPKVWLNVLDKGITFLNEYSENVSRFTTYMTSREMGRSIERSIWDAKEITVNFNKRGAGKSVAGKWEEGNRLNYIQAWMAQNFRNAYVFFNAGVQGMSNVVRTFKAHKGKMISTAATYFAAGLALPAITQVLNTMLGGNEEEYYNLPEWVRRSNLCIYTGNGWVTIPLPIEMRAFYGLGELAYCATQRRQDENVATAALSQLTQILPIDFMEGGGGMQAFIPSHFKPIAEAYMLNKDWTGKPIYKETAFNENAPEWTKTYKGTNSVLTWLSKTANEWSGGDSVEKGDVDINPAKVQHVFEGYFGGVAKILTKVYDTMAMPFDEDKREWRNVPIFSSLYQTADDKTRDRMTKNKFFEYYNEYMETRDRLSKYEQKDNEDGLTLREKANYQTLLNSEKGVRKEIMDDYADDIKELRDEMKTLDDKSEAYKKDEVELIGIYREVNHAMMMADDAFAKKVGALWKKMDAINEKYKTEDDEELSEEDEAAREKELEGPRRELNKLFDEAEGIKK